MQLDIKTTVTAVWVAAIGGEGIATTLQTIQEARR
jgi:hypothetical protein